MTIDQTNEVWRVIDGTNYKVSNIGNVMHTRNKMKLCLTKSGYYRINLGRKKIEYVHRLVAKAFLPDTHFEGASVNHKNGVKTDNRIENLEWLTLSDNTKHQNENGMCRHDKGENAGRAILNNDQVITIKQRLKSGDRIVDISKEYKVAFNTISSIKRGVNWSHI